jgi:hypothetical protein
MTCPRCSQTDAGTVDCSRCGVVFAKLGQARPPATVPVISGAPIGSPLKAGAQDWLHWIGIIGFAVGLVAIWGHVSAPPPEVPRAAPTPAPVIIATVPSTSSPVETSDNVAEEAHGTPWPLAAPMPERTVEVPRAGAADADSLEPADREMLNRLIAPRAPVESDPVGTAEELFRKYPGSVRVRNTLVNLLFAASYQAQKQGQSRPAIAFLARATQVAPELPPTWERLINMQMEAYAWSECERVARAALRAHSGNVTFTLCLARALMMQDRNDEAADVLRRTDDPTARAMVAQIERGQQHEAGMKRGSSSHFSLLFEGPPDGDFGQAVLAVLERRYTEYTSFFEGEPSATIPVVLYSKEQFRAISKAAPWASAYYSHYDGRIRVSFRGLSPTLSSDLEETLAHELAHAFVNARSRGLAPSDVNEGVAQYLSGRRTVARLSRARAAAGTAVGQVDAYDFYDGALDFVEFLLGRYRPSAMNELLVAMRATGSVDAAFRKAYDKSHEALRQEWLAQLPSS